MRRTAVALTLALALIVAALAAGAWELRRLDHDVKALRAEVEGGERTDARLDGVLKSLAALTRETTKLRESGIRQEFYLPLQQEATRLVVAVIGDYSDCGAAQRQWQSHVNDKLIPYINDPDNRALRTALRHDDPDYRATLLNAFTITC